jgi:hypothetical protein
MNKRLRKHLLACLHAAGEFTVLVNALVEDSESWTQSEIESELRLMEAQRLVVSARDRLDNLRYTLSTDGRAAVAELRL